MLIPLHLLVISGTKDSPLGRCGMGRCFKPLGEILRSLGSGSSPPNVTQYRRHSISPAIFLGPVILYFNLLRFFNCRISYLFRRVQRSYSQIINSSAYQTSSPVLVGFDKISVLLSRTIHKFYLYFQKTKGFTGLFSYLLLCQSLVDKIDKFVFRVLEGQCFQFYLLQLNSLFTREGALGVKFYCHFGRGKFCDYLAL